MFKSLLLGAYVNLEWDARKKRAQNIDIQQPESNVINSMIKDHQGIENTRHRGRDLPCEQRRRENSHGDLPCEQRDRRRERTPSELCERLAVSSELVDHQLQRVWRPLNEMLAHKDGVGLLLKTSCSLVGLEEK